VNVHPAFANQAPAAQPPPLAQIIALMRVVQQPRGSEHE